MSYQDIFKRYEMKYMLTKEQKELVLQAMAEYMKPDEFGRSTICNIYFDTPDYQLIRRSLEKPVYKEKLRVRSYGKAKEDGTVFVELKKKYKGVVYKRRISTSEKEAMAYLIQGEELSKQSQITDEISYFKQMYQGLQPAVYLSYLSRQEQLWLVEAMEANDCTPSVSQALQMKAESAAGKLTQDSITALMCKEKANQKERLKIPMDRIRKYFPASYTNAQMEEEIVKMCELRYRKRTSRER